MAKFILKDPADSGKLVLDGAAPSDDGQSQMAIGDKENADRPPNGDASKPNGRQFSVPLVSKNDSTCFCNYFSPIF